MRAKPGTGSGIVYWFVEVSQVVESATETADYRESGERSVMNCVNKMEIVYLSGSCNIVFIQGKSGRPIPEQKGRKTIIEHPPILAPGSITH